MKNVWTTSVIAEPERRNILDINYGKLKKVIEMENQTRVFSLMG
jgi:hypothetical protein